MNALRLLAIAGTCALALALTRPRGGSPTAPAGLREVEVRKDPPQPPAAGERCLDAVTAAESAHILPDSESEEVLERAALDWFERSPDAALAWARQLPASESNDRIVATLACELADADPLGALVIAAGLPPSEHRDELCRHAASQWATADPQAAAEWAQGIEDETLRELILGSVAIVAATPSSQEVPAVPSPLVH